MELIINNKILYSVRNNTKFIDENTYFNSYMDD